MRVSRTFLVFLVCAVAGCSDRPDVDMVTGIESKPTLQAAELPVVDWSFVTDRGPPPRAGTNIAYDEANRRTVIFGGITIEGLLASPDQPLGDTWVLRDDTWSELAGLITPPARSNGAMTFDPRRAILVMFGGSKALFDRNDTWELDRASWRKIETSNQPAPRIHAGMDYDRARGKVVLYGGLNQSTDAILSDLWEYDGSDWTLIESRVPAGRRAEHVFVYDRSRDVFVVQGGLDNDRNVLGDTWEYDGTSWQEVASARDLPLWDHGGAWNEDLQGVIMFGGLTREAVQPQDTWVMRHDDWEPVPTQTSPPVRRDTRIVYDAYRNRNLLFGGWETDGGLDGVNDDDFGDLWELRLLTPQEQIDGLIASVEALVDMGTLSQDQGAGLIEKLGEAIEKLDDGKVQPAINQLEAFMNQVQGFVNAGKLSTEAGQHLIDCAQIVIDGLSSD